MRRPLLLLLALLAVSPSPATGAERPEIRLVLTADRDRVVLGGEILLTATLERLRGRPIEVSALRVAQDSAWFRVEAGGQTWRIARTFGEIGRTAVDAPLSIRPADSPRVWLARGTPLDLKEFPLIALRPGRMTIRAVYSGLPGREEPLESAPIAVEVVPDGEKGGLGARIETSEGGVTVELWPHRSPASVHQFVSLARAGFYDGLTFHRILPGYLLQGGDPKGDGTGGPGYFVADELDREVPFERGLVGLARIPGVPDSAGSQFFVLLGAAPRLTGTSTAIGRVIEGMETLDRLADRPLEAEAGETSKPREPPLVRSIRVATR